MNASAQSLLLLMSFAVWGCSPFGRKSEPKELFPADSVSRSIARSITHDPLVLNFRQHAGENAYFSSMLFGTDTTVWLGDLGRHAIRRFTFDGTELDPIEGFSFPYLVGHEDDTVAVYDAGLNRLVSVADSSIGRELPPVEAEQGSLSRQIAALDGVFYMKDAAGPSATLYRLDEESSTILASLPGPSWHHHGVMDIWLGRVVSVSSYWPVLYTFALPEGIDSMRLQGFDSPMLARVRAYTIGSVNELPLIISGIDGVGDRLYVINVRPGYIRLDVFDSTARLIRVLQYEEPEPSGYTPVDLVVRSEGDSTYAFVASVSTVYGPLSLQYASQLDRFAFPSTPPP